MISRLNFLFGLGLLIVIGFYFVGRYALVMPVSVLAPSWAKPLAGLVVLAALGLTVQLLALSIGKFSGVASYDEKNTVNALSIASQVALSCGHAGLVYAISVFFTRGIPPSVPQILVAAALYGAGVVIAIHEWRQRRAGIDSR